MDQNQLEQYWNDKYPKNPVIYSGRSIPTICPTCESTTLKANLNIDVRTMISSDDHLMKTIIEHAKLKGDSHDQTMWNIQKWVVKNLAYVGDQQSGGTPEFWQFPFETIARCIGDCEDGAILIASLALNAGIPPFRVRVNAGFVQIAPTAPEGGHGYVTYLRESDNVHVAIDWCFYPDDATEIKDKTPFKDNPYYKQIWFSFNNLYCWSEKQLNIQTRLASTNK